MKCDPCVQPDATEADCMKCPLDDGCGSTQDKTWYRILNEQTGFRWIEEEYHCDYIGDIEEAVNFLINIGWEPLGGVASIGTASKAFLTQAMLYRGTNVLTTS